MSDDKFSKIVSLTKRRGFIYPNSELYGGLGGVYDFGPYGVELANNIKKLWWSAMVYEHENIVGLDSAIFYSPEVWKASGHVDSFSDPLMECKTCNTRVRADHVLEDLGEEADEKMSDDEINALLKKHEGEIKCPKCGGKDFTLAKSFNLLVQSNLGNFTGNWDEPTYLRAETAQGIYINFKNVLDSMRVRVPFGIAQIGKAFRNEISPRQFIFRKREFEQMEMQYFVRPESAGEEYEAWKEKRMRFYTETLKFKKENLRFKDHENLVFYASAATDIEYNFPKLGFKEMEGVHHRGDYDLSQHEKRSGKELKYLDPQTGEKFTPNVIEASSGLDRVFFAVLSEFYDEDELGGEKRVVLRFPFELAPVKMAVFPLLKNKPELVARAKEIFDELKTLGVLVEFDDSGNIGKRYRRQDEIGTPCCVTIDFDTLQDNTVTLRERDTGKQKRILANEIKEFLMNSE